MRDLSALYTESAKKIHQNRLTHLCVAVVNCLGDSDKSPMMLSTNLPEVFRTKILFVKYQTFHFNIKNNTQSDHFHIS